MPPETNKPLDERWGAYPETVLIFDGDPQVFIDLREPVPPATRNALTVLGLGEPFSILTAFNPRGQDISPEENDRRMKQLEAELTSSDDEFVRVDACSPDKSHCECSVAIKGDMKRALDIARRWEQIAIFWWDGSRFWIQGAITDGHLELPVTDTHPE
jgi:hypothetical protein